MLQRRPVTLTPETGSPPQPLLTSTAARRTSRNATALTLSAFVTKGLLFFWQIYLARGLGAELYGVYGAVSAMLIIGASIPEFGLGLIVIRDVASHPQDSRRYLAATLVIQPILAVVGYGFLLILATSLGLDARLRGLLALAAWSLLIDTLGNMGHNQLIAFEHMVLTSIISIGHTAVLIVLGVAALALSKSLWNLYLAILAASTLRATAYWVALLRLGIRPAFPVTGTLIRYLMINGAPFALTAFVSLAYINSDKLLATMLIGSEATGQLMASFVIVFGVIELLSTPMLVTVYPWMSRLHNNGEYDKVNLMLEKLSFLTLLASLPVALYTSLLAVPLAALIFGDSFVGAAAVLRIMIWYVLIAMIANVFSQVLAVQNRQRWLLLVRITGLMLSIALNLILLPRIGVSGTAYAMIVSELLVLVLLLRSLNLPHRWWQHMISYVWRLAIAAALLAATTIPLAALHPLLAIVVGLPLYAASLFVVGVFTEEDRALFKQLVETMPGGMSIIRLWKR